MKILSICMFLGLVWCAPAQLSSQGFATDSLCMPCAASVGRAAAIAQVPASSAEAVVDERLETVLGARKKRSRTDYALVGAVTGAVVGGVFGVWSANKSDYIGPPPYYFSAPVGALLGIWVGLSLAGR